MYRNMKKAISFLCLIAAMIICLPLTSCSKSPSKDNLVGKWQAEVLLDGVKASSILTLDSGGEYRHDLVMTFNREHPDGSTFKLTVNGCQLGEWGVDGDMIYLNASSADAKVTDAKVSRPNAESYVADSSKLQELSDQLSMGMEAAMSESLAGQVVSLQPNSFTLKTKGSSDFSYTRID